MRLRPFFILLLHCFLATWMSYKPLATNLDDKENYGDVQFLNSTFKKTISSEGRRKRDIWQLYSVITCVTPCDPLVLKDYGCYCGLGGTGHPIDSIDRCCMLHDDCYHHTSCHRALTYFLPYNWKCVGGRPYCTLPSQWSPAYNCAIQLCECDRMFSECLNSYGCPKYKAICKSSEVRRLWQKLLIKLGIG